MKFRKLLVLGLLASVLNPSFAAKKATTKQTMNKALDSLVNLFPYAHDHLKFRETKNEEYIETQLQNIQEAFKNAKHNKRLDAPGFRPSFETINEFLDSTKDSFGQKHKEFARQRVLSLSGLCVSCHSQLGKQSSKRFKMSLQKVGKSKVGGDFEYGNFLFLLRDYTSSARYFEKYLSSFASRNDRNFDNYKEALQKLITINLKISYRPERAMMYLDKYGKGREIPRMLKDDFKDWSMQVKAMEKSYKMSRVNGKKDFLKYEMENLSKLNAVGLGDGSKDMLLLAASGVLTKYLNAYPRSKESPRALYWLAVAQRRLSFNFFYSLGELYLKECIQRYPKHSYAKKCFGEYKELIEFGYTGSSGLAIPTEERNELKRLQSLISK